jgi:hypothetical protein
MAEGHDKRRAEGSHAGRMSVVLGLGLLALSLTITLIFVLISTAGPNQEFLNGEANSIANGEISQADPEGRGSAESQAPNRSGVSDLKPDSDPIATGGGTLNDSPEGADSARSPTGDRPPRNSDTESPSQTGQPTSGGFIGPPAPGAVSSAQQPPPAPPPPPPPAPPPDAPPLPGSANTDPSEDPELEFTCSVVVSPHLTISETVEIRISGANRSHALLRVGTSVQSSDQVVALLGGSALVLFTHRSPAPPSVELIDLSSESTGTVGCSFNT